MRRLYVPLREAEIDALREIAERERRQPPMQAAVLLGEAIWQRVHDDGTGACQADEIISGSEAASQEARDGR